MTTQSILVEDFQKAEALLKRLILLAPRVQVAMNYNAEQIAFQRLVNDVQCYLES